MTPKRAQKYIAAIVDVRSGMIAREVTIYHCLRWCNSIRREFWFTLDPKIVDQESRVSRGGEYNGGSFDARNLPLKYITHNDSIAWPIDWIRAALIDGFDLAAITECAHTDCLESDQLRNACRRSRNPEHSDEVAS